MGVWLLQFQESFWSVLLWMFVCNLKTVESVYMCNKNCLEKVKNISTFSIPNTYLWVMELMWCWINAHYCNNQERIENPFFWWLVCIAENTHRWKRGQQNFFYKFSFRKSCCNKTKNVKIIDAFKFYWISISFTFQLR